MSVEFDRESPGSLTQGLLIGKLLIGGLGVIMSRSGYVRGDLVCKRERQCAGAFWGTRPKTCFAGQGRHR